MAQESTAVAAAGFIAGADTDGRTTLSSLLYRGLIGRSADPSSLRWLASKPTGHADLAAEASIGQLAAARLLADAEARGLSIERVAAGGPRPAGARDVAPERSVERELRGLLRIRRDLGFAFLDKSPIFWSVAAYRLSEWLLGATNRRRLAAVAELIPERATVTDLCCGPADLYTRHLAAKGCDYIGLDFNSRFRRQVCARGVDYRFIRLPEDPIPAGDFVVMCSSFYHFRDCEAELLRRMRLAARRRVVIAEPIQNLSNHGFRPLARLANGLTAPGVGRHDFRHDADTFRRFAERNGAIDLTTSPRGYHSIAVFEAER